MIFVVAILVIAETISMAHNLRHPDPPACHDLSRSGPTICPPGVTK